MQANWGCRSRISRKKWRSASGSVDAHGVIVTDVADNSTAAAQGIEREDVITEVDGKPVTSVGSFREALSKSRPEARRAALPRPPRQQKLSPF